MAISDFHTGRYPAAMPQRLAMPVSGLAMPLPGGGLSGASRAVSLDIFAELFSRVASTPATKVQPPVEMVDATESANSDSPSSDDEDRDDDSNGRLRRSPASPLIDRHGQDLTLHPTLDIEESHTALEPSLEISEDADPSESENEMGKVGTNENNAQPSQHADRAAVGHMTPLRDSEPAVISETADLQDATPLADPRPQELPSEHGRPAREVNLQQDAGRPPLQGDQAELAGHLPDDPADGSSDPPRYDRKSRRSRQENAKRSDRASTNFQAAKGERGDAAANAARSESAAARQVEAATKPRGSEPGNPSNHPLAAGQANLAASGAASSASGSTAAASLQPSAAASSESGFGQQGVREVNSAASVGAPDGRSTSETTASNKSLHSGKDGSEPDAVARAKIVQRVSRAFHQLGGAGGVVRMRLAPAELGSVRIEMRVQDRRVEARVVAESETASQILREHLPELRQRLESQGLQVERIEVQTEQESAADPGHGFGRHREGQNDRDPASPWAERATRSEKSPQAASRTSIGTLVRELPSPLNAAGVDARW